MRYTLESIFAVTLVPLTIKFRGSAQQYGVLDTRAAGIKPGDRLSIACVKRWQWSGTHGYDCNFVDLERR